MDDLYIIKKNHTAGSTEMHILSADSNYQEFALHTGTPLQETGDNFDFVVTPHLGQEIVVQGNDVDPRDLKNLGNLIVICKTFGNINTLYTLTGFTGFQEWGDSFLTTLPAINDNDYWDFVISLSFDLAAIQKNTLDHPTASGFTEMHVLTQKSQYQEIVTIVTGLQFSDGNFSFRLASNNDLFIIKRNGLNSTEVHVLSFESNYQEFILQQGTPLGFTDDTWDFLVDSDRNLVIIDKGSPTDPLRRTGTGSTEVHILSADSNYQEFIFQSGTPLEMTGSNFKFCNSLDQYLVIDVPD